MAEKKKEILSISKIAFRYGLDRATVSKRLQEAGIEPVEEKEKEKLYEINEALEIAVTAAKPIDRVKLRKEIAAAEEKELKVAEKKGELLSASEVAGLFQSLFSGLYRTFTNQQPNRLAGKLAKAKTSAEARKILSEDAKRIFSEMREDFTPFLDDAGT